MAYLLSLQSENVVLADVDPAWKRDMAAMIIQGHVRMVGVSRKRTQAIQEWLEQGFQDHQDGIYAIDYAT